MTKPVIKTIEMTKMQHKAWDKHLRSGKIKQTQMEMKSSDGAMCCLGVLEFALEGKVRKKDVEFPSNSFLKKHNIKFYNENGKPVDQSECSPFLGGGYAHDLNDVGLSFKQIAQRIATRVKYIPEKKDCKEKVLTP